MRGRRVILGGLAALALVASGCSSDTGGSATNTGSNPSVGVQNDGQPASVPRSISDPMPVYGPAPTSGLVTAVADFTHLAACDHPCTAPIYKGPGNKTGAMVTTWPCEYYIAVARAATPTDNTCVDPVKAASGKGDEIGVVCRVLGDADPTNGLLADDRGKSSNWWLRVVIPALYAKFISNPAAAPVASDGTYQGYVSQVWLRLASNQRGSQPMFDVTARECAA